MIAGSAKVEAEKAFSGENRSYTGEVGDVTIFSALKSAGTASASGRDWFARDSVCRILFFLVRICCRIRGAALFPVEIARPPARSLVRSLARALARLARARGPRVGERNLYHFLPGQPRPSVIILIRRWTFDDEIRGGVVTGPLPRPPPL